MWHPRLGDGVDLAVLVDPEHDQGVASRGTREREAHLVPGGVGEPCGQASVSSAGRAVVRLDPALGVVDRRDRVDRAVGEAESRTA